MVISLKYPAIQRICRKANSIELPSGLTVKKGRVEREQKVNIAYARHILCVSCTHPRLFCNSIFNHLIIDTTGLRALIVISPICFVTQQVAMYRNVVETFQGTMKHLLDAADSVR